MPDNHVAFVGSVPENYDQYLGPVFFAPYADNLVGRLELSPGARVLELACGTGIVTQRLAARFGSSVEIVATDLNDAMLAYAKSKFAGSDETLAWRQGDASDLPFPDQRFDAIVCQFGVMFFSDKEKAFAEACRVLKTGGVFLFNVWAAIDENELQYIAHTIIAKFFDDNPPDFYQVPFAFHDPETIASLLASTGFQQISINSVSLNATAQSARELTRGLVHGNPIIAPLRERAEAHISEIENAVQAEVVRRCGDAPVNAKMRALVCLGVKPQRS
jgi:ubiquinone/menaquinone biosynthesis C-methylase UbiE